MHTEPQNTGARTAGNVGSGLTGLLKQLGIAPASDADAAVDLVKARLRAMNLTAEVAGLRYGTLTIVAEPTMAGLLRFAQDTIRNEVEQKHPGLVQKVSIQTPH